MCGSCAITQQREQQRQNPKPRYQRHTADIECPRCGRTRPLIINSHSEHARALKRICANCQIVQLPNNLTGNYPDVDEITVEHLIAGHPTPATPAERRQAIAYLTIRKASASEIARRIGCTQRTVERHRQRLAS
jgi:hypothetical protein